MCTFKIDRDINKFSFSNLFNVLQGFFPDTLYFLGDICSVRQYIRVDKKNINSCWNGTTPLLTAIRVHNAEIVQVQGLQICLTKHDNLQITERSSLTFYIK